jgi:hypothetical protein
MMACATHGDECSPKWKEYWPKFVEGMKKRFQAGHAEYSDKVFERSAPELIAETLQEAEDIIGWGFILRYRLQQLLKNSQTWYPHERAMELLESTRGQCDKLIVQNQLLRSDIRTLLTNVAGRHPEIFEKGEFSCPDMQRLAEDIRLFNK